MEQLPGPGASEGKYVTPPENLINEALPLEVFVQILSLLGTEEKIPASLVNRHWNATAIDTEIRQEGKPVEDFLDFIITHLDQKEDLKAVNDLKDLRGNLGGLLERINALQIKRISQVKSSIIKAEQDLKAILKTLDEKKLKKLKKLSKKTKVPILFKDTIYMSKIEKKIDAADLLPQHQRDTNLHIISKELVVDGYVNKSIEVAKMITVGKDWALQDISNNLVFEKKDFKTAVSVVALMNDSERIDKSINTILFKLPVDGDFDHSIYDEALKVVSKLKEGVRKDRLIKIISTAQKKIQV